MATSGQLLKFVDELSVVLDKKQTLTNLKVALTSTSTASLRQAAPNISFESVFQCLNDDDVEVVHMCSDVLITLLGVLDPHALIDQFHGELLQGLKHSKRDVRLLCLKQVFRACESTADLFINHQDMVKQLVALITDDSMEVANISISSLTLIGNEALFNDNVMAAIQTVMDQNVTVRFRVYELMVKISVQSADGMNLCTSHGLMQQLINEVPKDDILVQLNALEILANLALSSHGMKYLEEQGVVTSLEQMMNSADENPLMSFLMPGLIKFFGCLAHTYPRDMSNRLKPFVNRLFSLIDSDDLSLKMVVIETLGLIGTTADGKLALDKQGRNMENAFSKIGDIVRYGLQENKIKALQSAIPLLTVKVADQTEELQSITECWYSHFGSNTLELIYNTALQPFTELRCSALSFFKALSLLPWGQRNLLNHLGFCEYIVDRSTERTKEGKEGKFAIISALVDSPTARNIFGSPYYVKLNQYRNEGPFYLRVETAVALEGAD